MLSRQTKHYSINVRKNNYSDEGIPSSAVGKELLGRIK
jgi:hypothetical protein